MLTMVDDDDSVLAALQVGARGYVLKGAIPGGGARRHPHRRRRWRRLRAACRRAGARRRDPRTSLRLTEREATVLALLADGESNAEIARELGITLKTVQNHVSHMLTKMQVRDRTQAALRARGL